MIYCYILPTFVTLFCFVTFVYLIFWVPYAYWQNFFTATTLQHGGKLLLDRNSIVYNYWKIWQGKANIPPSKFSVVILTNVRLGWLTLIQGYWRTSAGKGLKPCKHLASLVLIHQHAYNGAGPYFDSYFTASSVPVYHRIGTNTTQRRRWPHDDKYRKDDTS